ncbi:hypothetical protein COCSUDRAFT_63271 [Coccomyxa subellipsoidea C-169]|uniref:Uncharacterized protein n=1 Tax=Coccomyxa subellipsoidea (strain C-169) TaxID=574566 RepID=I0YZC7_COCSC|nr:hypothetical protein COCSUDRAFT_63271 [Coccomyxa subellipsoidea C-169]EIE23746.1 hypothetical protein COCSUDRAFT_63271 [Coccomyxa subellipsoidea C-169]|eukprot:XP_005648290.1 hypothetical protein COCSUDRAFT_63271 [Coccomyxa subellipsoidea C-169]
MAESSGRNLLQVRLRDTDAAWKPLISGLVELRSIFALLLVGFVVGLFTGAALIICWRGRRKTLVSCERGFTSPAAPMPGNDYTHQGVKHKKTQSALIRDDAVRRSGVTGPLGVGIVLQSIDLSKENREPGNIAAKLQRQSVDDWSVVDLTSEQDCNYNRATFKPIPENKEKERVPGLELGTIAGGTIKAGWGRGSAYAHSAVEGISAMSIREAAAAGAAALPGRGPQPRGNAGKAAPPPPPPPPKAANPGSRPGPPPDAAKNQGKMRERSSEQAGVADLSQQAAQAAAELRRRADEQKHKAAAGVAPAYDLDDLDDEWKALLSELEDRLYQEGKQGMDAEDRAVAVRSLLVSTARETPEAALGKALDDIDRHRRAARRSS